MTARTVRRKEIQSGKIRMAYEIKRTCQKVQRRELRGYSSISQFPTTLPVGRLAAKHQVPGLLWRTG
eukprot:595456-Pleurochrysis_carterae.AAC.2